MLKSGSFVKIVDNSGAKTAKCLKVCATSKAEQDNASANDALKSY